MTWQTRSRARSWSHSGSRSRRCSRTTASPPRRGSRFRSRALMKDMGERLAPRPASAARPRTPWNSPLLDFPCVPSSKHWDIRNRIRREYRPENPPVHELPKAGCPTSEGRPGGSERLVGVGVEGKRPGDACAPPRWRRRRGRQSPRGGAVENGKDEGGQRLQRRRPPAASGSCARLTARAAGVGCVALPDTLRVRRHAAASVMPGHVDSDLMRKTYCAGRMPAEQAVLSRTRSVSGSATHPTPAARAVIARNFPTRRAVGALEPLPAFVFSVLYGPASRRLPPAAPPPSGRRARVARPLPLHTNPHEPL